MISIDAPTMIPTRRAAPGSDEGGFDWLDVCCDAAPDNTGGILPGVVSVLTGFVRRVSDRTSMRLPHWLQNREAEGLGTPQWLQKSRSPSVFPLSTPLEADAAGSSEDESRSVKSSDVKVPHKSHRVTSPANRAPHPGQDRCIPVRSLPSL